MATADELKKTLEGASEEEARALLAEELNRGEEARSTVVAAAEARLEVLAIPGEAVSSPPSGAWAQLLDGEGNPVEQDGKPVQTELVR